MSPNLLGVACAGKPCGQSSSRCSLSSTVLQHTTANEVLIAAGRRKTIPEVNLMRCHKRCYSLLPILRAHSISSLRLGNHLFTLFCLGGCKVSYSGITDVSTAAYQLSMVTQMCLCRHSGIIAPKMGMLPQPHHPPSLVSHLDEHPMDKRAL